MKFYARLECVAVEAKRKGEGREGLEGHAYLQLASIAPAPTLFPVHGFDLILIVDRTRGKLGMARSQRPDTAPSGRPIQPTLNWTLFLRAIASSYYYSMSCARIAHWSTFSTTFAVLHDIYSYLRFGYP